jgi:CRISPR-associated protein Cas2
MDIDKYKVGWLIVAFDLPVGTKAQRKAAHDFREWLKDDGFQMLQWSLYARPCVSNARHETHADRVRSRIPSEGSVRMLFVTRCQWERSFVIRGSPAAEVPPEDLPDQLQLW